MEVTNTDTNCKCVRAGFSEDLGYPICEASINPTFTTLSEMKERFMNSYVSI